MPLSVPKDAEPLKTFTPGLSHGYPTARYCLGTFPGSPMLSFLLSCLFSFASLSLWILFLFWATPSDIFSSPHSFFLGYQLVLLYFSPVCWLVPPCPCREPSHQLPLAALLLIPRSELWTSSLFTGRSGIKDLVFSR